MGLTLVGASAIFMGACSNQGEGERCETDNGNDDCQDGLYCKSVKGAASSFVCCPVDPAAATEPICQAQVSPGDGGGIPDSSSPPPADATTDVATDGQTDSATSDANDDAADANDDGG